MSKSPVRSIAGIAAALSLLALLQGCGGDCAPKSLMCEYRADPIGLETLNPRLSWQTADGQVAWRVRVASTMEKLSSGEADLWDSGKVCGGDTFGIAYAGRKPSPSLRAYWQVKTWTGRGESSWSAPARWQWGMLGEDWGAKWISAGSEVPTPCFERSFTLKAKPLRADLHITGVGYYEATLNGRRVGSKMLDPSPTDYCKTVLYSTYQVEDSLRQGDNKISVLVGHGLYCVHCTDFKRQLFDKRRHSETDYHRQRQCHNYWNYTGSIKKCSHCNFVLTYRATKPIFL